MNTCERCGRTGQTVKVVNMQNPKQQSHICQKCVATVIRENTVWQVKR